MIQAICSLLFVGKDPLAVKLEVCSQMDLCLFKCINCFGRVSAKKTNKYMNKFVIFTW